MIDLGLTAEYFWSLTPAQFQFLWRRHLARVERSDRRFGWLWTQYANAHRDKEQKPMPYEIDDFMPRLNQVRAQQRQAPQSIEDQIEMCRLFTEAMSMPQRRMS